MAFVQFRKEFLNSQKTQEVCRRFSLHEEKLSFMEESFNEENRVSGTKISETGDDYHMKDITGTVRHTANVAKKANNAKIQRAIWKRQMSKSFFTGGNPPCPILTALCMQRQPQDFCFECHSSNTFSDWLDGQARAMKVESYQIMSIYVVFPLQASFFRNM